MSVLQCSLSGSFGEAKPLMDDSSCRGKVLSSILTMSILSGSADGRLLACRPASFSDFSSVVQERNGSFIC